jgi:hypothetical protein
MTDNVAMQSEWDWSRRRAEAEAEAEGGGDRYFFYSRLMELIQPESTGSFFTP